MLVGSISLEGHRVKTHQFLWEAFEVCLIIMGTVSLLPAIPAGAAVFSMIAWVLLAAFYVLATLVQARKQRLVPDDAPIPEALTPWSPTLVSLLACTPVIAGFMGLSGGLVGLLAPTDILQSSPEIAEITPEALIYVGYARTTIAVTMAILGWFVLHLGYARHYQRIAAIDGRGLEVPGTLEANLTDYVYFALTLGTTFATSDTNIISRRMRWNATVHSVLAFFYNAVVMAVAFRLITD